MEKIKPKKKLPKLKPNESRFVETYVKLDFNGTKAVQTVYGVKNSDYARLKAHRLITKDNISQAIEVKKESLKEALINRGVTPEKIAEKVEVLLEAKSEGKIDYNAVDKGLKHAKDIYGVEDLNEKPKSNNTYNFIFNSETQEEIKKIEEKIKQRLINPNVQAD